MVREMVREPPGVFRVKVFVFGGLLWSEVFIWLVGRGYGERCSSGLWKAVFVWRVSRGCGRRCLFGGLVGVVEGGVRLAGWSGFWRAVFVWRVGQGCGGWCLFGGLVGVASYIITLV